ncbi:MAG: MFS transporter [Gammaproteobacteria bacterium]|nr:MFS transporter [Gammaproteobacteria bacterium]
MQNKRAVWSWALYDWGNSAYATAVMAGFFPIFFKSYWGESLPASESTFYLGLGNSIASLAIVLLAPVLGAIADVGNKKKTLLTTFAFLGILMTALLGLIEQGQWLLALIIYVGASLGFSGSVVFYDSLLVDVSPRNKLDQISALGFAMGYAGGGLLFAISVLMVTYPQWFGLADAVSAIKLSYFMVAIWWLVFTLPVLLYVKETPVERRAEKPKQMVRAGLRQLIETFAEIRRFRIAFTFLIGYWLYIDGVDTIVRMAIDYGISLGMDSNDLIVALLITQFVGFPAAIVYGYVGNRVGPKRALYFGIFVYLMVVLWAYQMQTVREFYAVAIVVGLVQGGVQALSRSVFARIIPTSRSAEFFGFYNMVGKFAAVLGPVIMGSVAIMTGSTRYAILSISILFILGAWFLYKTDLEEGERIARGMDS